MKSPLPFLLVTVFLNIAGFSLILPLLPFYGTLFNASPFAIACLFAAYSLGSVFGEIYWGRRSDAIGRRPVMIWGMALYTVGSVACTVAPNYESLIAARILQGATAGVGVVIGRSVIRDLYHGARAQKLMSLTTMIFAIAPAVAPNSAVPSMTLAVTDAKIIGEVLGIIARARAAGRPRPLHRGWSAGRHKSHADFEE